MIVLDTSRLALRHLQDADADAMFRVFGDAEVMRFGDGVQTIERVHAWLRHAQDSYRERGFGPWAVVEKRSGDVIGYCGLFYFDDVGGQAEVEIGYRLARAHWGRGYATEAVAAVRDYPFGTLCLPRLIAMIDPGNVASIRVAEKVGLRYEKDVMLAGYDHPDHVYALARTMTA